MHARGLTGTLAAFTLALTGQLVVASPASAATSWWVDNTSSSCSNSGPGTATTPFGTIRAAAAKAVSAGRRSRSGPPHCSPKARSSAAATL